MVDVELANMTEDTSPALTDLVYKVDSGGTTDRKVTIDNLMDTRVEMFSATVTGGASMSVASIPTFKYLVCRWSFEDTAAGNNRPSLVINDDTTAANYSLNQVYERNGNTLANSAFNGSEAFFRFHRQNGGSGEQYVGEFTLIGNTSPFDDGYDIIWQNHTDTSLEFHGRASFGGSVPTKLLIKNTNVLDANFDGRMDVMVVK